MRREAAALAAKDAAEASERTKTQFLAHISHEIRTPLHTVIGLTEATLQTSLSATQRDHLRTVLDAGDPCSTRSTSWISRGSNREAWSSSTSSSTCTIRSAGRSTRSRSAPGQGAVALLLDRSTGAGDADRRPARLRQVLTNLLDNAIKFTARGEVAAEVELEAADGYGYTVVYFSVRDTGPGIAAEQLDRIFEPFEQVRSTVAAGHRLGTRALDLPAARRADGRADRGREQGRRGQHVPLHRQLRRTLRESPSGWLRCAGALRTLRRHAMAPRRAHRSTTRAIGSNRSASCWSRTARRTRRWRSQSSRRMATRSPSRATARRAVECAAAGGFDAVLMDVEMPILDGLQATAAIRAAEATAGGHVPIIAMTAHTLHGDRERCIAAGMDDYIAKPIRRRELFQVLARGVRKG